jgi:hypothetical protein
MLKRKDGRITDETIKIMSEISSSIYNMDCSCFINCEDLYDSLHSQITSLHNQKIKHKIGIKSNKNGVYNSARRMISDAKKRVILCQKTSSLLLGPRAGNNEERYFNDSLFEWLLNGNSTHEFIHLFSKDETANEMKSNEYDVALSKQRMVALLDNAKVNLSFRAYSTSYSLAHMIIDNNMLLSFFIDTSRYNILLPHFITSHDKVQEIIHDSQSIGEALAKSEILQLYD